MNKTEMVKLVADGGSLTKAGAERAINLMFQLMAKAILEEGRFDISGFGLFKKVQRQATNRPNPQKPGEKVHVPAHWTVKFKPAPALKATVNA